jgi:hypothetical protein
MRTGIIILIAMGFLPVFQKCTFLSSNRNVKLVNQELIYDSINNKSRFFDVNLYTTLDFKKKCNELKDYRNIYIVIDKDTLRLIPEKNIKGKEDEHNIIQIKYFSKINFKSKIYQNDSLSKIILNQSKIINNKGKEIKKSDYYSFKSLITFHKIKEGALKHE